MKIMAELQKVESYGFKISWAMTASGVSLGFFDLADINEYATEMVSHATNAELPAIACLTSHSITRDEMFQYLLELSPKGWNLEIRQWLVIKLETLLLEAQKVLQKPDLQAEDDPRIIRIFQQLEQILPHLHTERNQEPIWVPEIFGHGFLNPLVKIIETFKHWLQEEKNWIKNKIIEES